jgi:hypothetical protein
VPAAALDEEQSRAGEHEQAGGEGDDPEDIREVGNDE